MLDTGFSFWDQLHNILRKSHKLFCQFINWTNWVNSGKLMDNCWISCQIMAGMKKVYNDLIIINLCYSKGTLEWNLYSRKALENLELGNAG